MERDDECDMRLHEDCVHCMATAITLFVGEDGKPLIPPFAPLPENFERTADKLHQGGTWS